MGVVSPRLATNQFNLSSLFQGVPGNDGLEEENEGGGEEGSVCESALTFITFLLQVKKKTQLQSDSSYMHF